MRGEFLRSLRPLRTPNGAENSEGNPLYKTKIKSETRRKEAKQRMKKEENRAEAAKETGRTAEKERKIPELPARESSAAREIEHTARCLQFQIEAADQGETVWNYLTRKKGFTKMQVKRMKFQPGGILVDKVQVRVTHVLAEGDWLEVSIEAPGRKTDQKKGPQSAQKMTREGIPDILYEDQDVLAVWKPHGMTLHPSHGHHGDTLMDQVQARIAQRDGADAVDIPLYGIGRLDSDTSGIVVFARNQVAAQRLWKQRADGRFQKQYLARCEGQFPEEAKEGQCISKPIAPVPGELNRMRADDAGKRAVTYYRIWRETEHETRLMVHLETGRTHQIRVHMAWLGHPLVGDSLYGNGTAGETYAALSACTATFFQPFTGEKITLNALDKAERGE